VLIAGPSSHRELECARGLAGGLTLRTGPFRFHIQSREPPVTAGIGRLYADFEIDGGAGFHDFHVAVGRSGGPRRWIKPTVDFFSDGQMPFKPLPADQAFALLEWGMNWCIATQAHHYLLIHAAVLERGHHCLILPGEPGAGKSTLTAALALSGWRLLSDEMTIVDRDDGLIAPLARPISLKNESIDIIRGRFPGAVFGDVARDTHKGTVSHLKPPADSVARMHEKGRARHVVFPRWRASASTSLTPRPKADAFMHLATHAFNYSLLGRLGFELNAALIDACDCWDFEYSDLDEALRVFEELTA
jgi:HprK-related kinase A